MSESASAPAPAPANPEVTSAPTPTTPVSLTATETATAAAPAPEPTAALALVPVPDPTTTAAPPPVPEMTAKAEAPSTPEPTAATPVNDKKLAEVEEPQNTLTKTFTDVEWNALKTFRADLPNILEQAFPDRADAKTTPVTIWGVRLDPNGSKDAKASVVLMKFLRARNLNPTAAKDMLVSTLRWRESFNIEAALKEEFPEDIFGPLGHIYGVDKDKRPVVYNLYGGNPDIKSVFSDVQRFIRWRVAFQERSVSLLDFNEVDQMIQIHDYEGVGFSSRDANSKAAASEATNIFQNHYPELLYKKFFINVPTLLNWIFWAFKPLIPAATLAKMSVVGTGQHAISKALCPYIDESNLPKRYGGAAEAF